MSDNAANLLAALAAARAENDRLKAQQAAHEARRNREKISKTRRAWAEGKYELSEPAPLRPEFEARFISTPEVAQQLELAALKANVKAHQMEEIVRLAHKMGHSYSARIIFPMGKEK